MNKPGKPLQSNSTGVEIFFSLMRSYFCFFVAAFNPCNKHAERRRKEEGVKKWGGKESQWSS
jgi:hypothetical protein